jgi:hypothetical protein
MIYSSNAHRATEQAPNFKGLRQSRYVPFSPVAGTLDGAVLFDPAAGKAWGGNGTDWVLVTQAN